MSAEPFGLRYQKCIFRGVYHFKDRMYQDTPPGTVAGLAWTSMGGAALYVESIVMKYEEGKGGLKVTGNIKDVMKGLFWFWS